MRPKGALICDSPSARNSTDCPLLIAFTASARAATTVPARPANRAAVAAESDAACRRLRLLAGFARKAEKPSYAREGKNSNSTQREQAVGLSSQGLSFCEAASGASKGFTDQAAAAPDFGEGMSFLGPRTLAILMSLGIMAGEAMALSNPTHLNGNVAGETDELSREGAPGQH